MPSDLAEQFTQRYCGRSKLPHSCCSREFYVPREACPSQFSSQHVLEAPVCDYVVPTPHVGQVQTYLFPCQRECSPNEGNCLRYIFFAVDMNDPTAVMTRMGEVLPFGGVLHKIGIIVDVAVVQRK